MNAGMGGIPGIVFVLGLISLTTANNSPTIDKLFYDVCENISIGEIAFTINASDVENDQLYFELFGPNAGYFQVNRLTGEVKVERKLDRESSDGVLNLDVKVSDYLNPIPTENELLIVLLDANDNAPTFEQSSYDTTIPENRAVGTTLFMVEARDIDSAQAAAIRYSIDNVVPASGRNLFAIGNSNGQVTLTESLNYTSKSTFYRLQIKATDGGGGCGVGGSLSSTVYSFITVEDVSDLDPKFFNLPYIADVQENSAWGLSVYQVEAFDQDTGINNKIYYSITNSTADGLFGISPDNGTIYVLSEIDRETCGSTVQLTIQATESEEDIHGVLAKTTANVQINIIDTNDNRPEFYKYDSSGEELSTHFTAEVLENSLGSISLNMMIKDADMMSNTKLTLEGEDHDVFSVAPEFTSVDSIVQLQVKQPQKLDFEKKQQMHLMVIATDVDDPRLQSNATVTINITDTNDNSPVFLNDTYALTVPEHSPVGTTIAKITAEDADMMDQGKITYRLLPDSILIYFDVKPHTGDVYVKNLTLLDREVRSLFYATLEARDTDDKPGIAVLEITVTDINDKHPVINRDSYLVFVKEGGTFELQITATDGDDPDTVNSQIVFGIEPSTYSDNFTINPDSGVLTNKGKLDREVLNPELNGRIELNVTATDKGTPPLSTVAQVIINVEDINDNTPQFGLPSYNFTVKEAEQGAFVGTVFAEDLDQTTEFNRISFRIINGGFGKFIIRTFADKSGYSGNITVDPDTELDYESDPKQFHLQVEATDLEQNKVEVMVEVNVLDVNDERPEFTETITVSLDENTNNSEVVGSFKALDKDTNHSLIYELESMKCRCNNSGELTDCSSFTLDQKGDVRVNPEHLMDYEQCNQVVIEAQAVDQFTEKGENNSVLTGKMVINIEDINDNAPEFIYSDSVFIVVSESASKGTSVAEVTALDRDSEKHRGIDFTVTKVQFKNTNNAISGMRTVFEAITTLQNNIYVGIIQTKEALDPTLKGKYLVTVKATDKGGLSASTELEIFTVDKEYQVVLGFSTSEEQVEKDLDKIVRTLTAATRAAVEILSITPDSDSDSESESRDSGGTVLTLYFIYANGSALTKPEVEKMISHEDYFPTLIALGLKNIGNAIVIEPGPDTLRFGLLGIVAGLIIVLAVLTTSLMCTRRNFKRKLKAAKAMNSASMVNSDNQKSGPVVPGTNKYTKEGANPVLNFDIDTTMVLDMNEESSDVDKVSLNSLDYIENMTFPEKETKSMLFMEEDNGPPEYTEPLGAALAQRGLKKDSGNAALSFNNPAFSTTDL